MTQTIIGDAIAEPRPERQRAALAEKLAALKLSPEVHDAVRAGCGRLQHQV